MIAREQMQMQAGIHKKNKKEELNYKKLAEALNIISSFNLSEDTTLREAFLILKKKGYQK